MFHLTNHELRILNFDSIKALLLHKKFLYSNCMMIYLLIEFLNFKKVTFNVFYKRKGVKNISKLIKKLILSQMVKIKTK